MSRHAGRGRYTLAVDVVGTRTPWLLVQYVLCVCRQVSWRVVVGLRELRGGAVAVDVKLVAYPSTGFQSASGFWLLGRCPSG